MFKLRDSKGQNRYLGSSKATVIDNRDPDNRGRIRVNHPLLGETSWIDYVSDFGTFGPPAVGEIVYVECDTGMYEFPYARGKVTKGNFASPSTPEAFKRTVPSNRGLFTPGGNFIEMDDGEAAGGSDPKDTNLTTKNRGIRITSKSGHKIMIQDDPDNGTETITILDKSGDGITFDSAAKKVSIVSKGDLSATADANITMSANADATITATGNGKFAGTGQTTVGDAGSPTKVDGQQVTLAGGGPGVARLGDRAIGIGNLGSPVTSTIIQGSFKVTSG